MVRRSKVQRKPVVVEQIDRGADGPANTARPFGEITRDHVLTYRGYLDAHLIDRMHYRAQLNDLQHQAAQRVIELHADAGFEPGVVGSYGPSGWNKGHDDDLEESAAITRFRKLLGSCSEAAALQLHSMCLGQHPGTARLASLQAALGDLVKQWGMGDCK